MPPLIITPTGDVLITLTSPPHPPTHYLVSSTILSASSPVFTAMLGPTSPFSEAVSLRRSQSLPSQTPHPQPLSDDDPTALAIILHAIHLQTSRVPRTVSFDQLMKLAIVTDKYDCAAAVRLWAECWMCPWKAFVGREGYERWVFIAWVFGAETEFKACTARLVKRVFESSGRLVWEKGGDAAAAATTTVRRSPGKARAPEVVGFDPYVPEVILAALQKQRAATLTVVLGLCSAAFTPLISPPRPFCKSAVKSPLCTSLVLSSLYRSFHTLRILPFTVESASHLSLDALVAALRDVKVQHLDMEIWDPEKGGRRKLEHSKTCDPMKGLLEGVGREMEKCGGLTLDGVGSGREGGRSWAEVEKEVAGGMLAGLAGL